jgi:hypothetical protein
MNAYNEKSVVGQGRELAFFLIPAGIIVAFSLMLVGIVASLNDSKPLTSSIETVLVGPEAPQPAQPAQRPAVAVASSKK